MGSLCIFHKCLHLSMKNADLIVVNFSIGLVSTGIPSVLNFVLVLQHPMFLEKSQPVYTIKDQDQNTKMFATQGRTKKQRKMPIETSVKTPEMNPVRTWFAKTFIKLLKPSIFSGNKDVRRDDL